MVKQQKVPLLTVKFHSDKPLHHDLHPFIHKRLRWSTTWLRLKYLTNYLRDCLEDGQDIQDPFGDPLNIHIVIIGVARFDAGCFF